MYINYNAFICPSAFAHARTYALSYLNAHPCIGSPKNSLRLKEALASKRELLAKFAADTQTLM